MRPRRLFWLTLASLLVGALQPISASPKPQSTTNTYDPVWADAPSVPTARSEAEWLVDMGWRLWDELFDMSGKPLCTPGQSDTFNFIGDTVNATVRAVGEHGCFWVEDRVGFDMAGLQAAATRFDEIYEIEHNLFGTEWLPGIDGDPRVHILNLETLGEDAVGLFDNTNECPAIVCPDSNEREMIYITMDWGPVGSDQHLTTIAHELQHLIQWNMDGNEFRWINEGFSQLAEHVNGFPIEYIASGGEDAYLRHPDYNLIDWPDDDEADTQIAYGSAFLFSTYLYDRFGPEFIRRISSQRRDGLAGIEWTLLESGITESVATVFVDWTLANILNSPTTENGRYSYSSLETLPTPYATQMNVGMMYSQGEVEQYGVDYYRIGRPGNYRLIFEGEPVIYLAPTEAPSGRWVWWSYWNDSGAAKLTGEFDLTGLDSATLEFSMWHDIEPGYDFLYVEVSRDGTRWEILRGDHSTTSGYLSQGPGYTGEQTEWVREHIDLSAYAGGQVWLRFEYLTDGSITHTGFLLDDIAIPELGFYDDVENGAGLWQANGFMRTPTKYTQRWAISVAQLGIQPHVERHYISNDSGAAELPITVGRDGAIVAISAITPFVRDSASYRYLLTTSR